MFGAESVICMDENHMGLNSIACFSLHFSRSAPLTFGLFFTIRNLLFVRVQAMTTL